METLFFSAASGLANRLRALVGCRVLADLLGTRLCVDWVINGACNARFGDLFEKTGWEDVLFVETSEWQRLSRSDAGVVINGEPWFTEIWKTHCNEASSIDDFNRSAVAHLQRLRPVSELRAQIDGYVAEHDLSSCTGIHVRSTDNVHDYENMARANPGFRMDRISKLEGFTALIDELVALGEPVFLCTDNDDIEQQILERHPGVLRHVKDYDTAGYERHVKKSFGRFGRLRRAADRVWSAFGRKSSDSTWRTTSVGDGLVDLLLLSHCREIVGTYYSSFSKVSALIGNSPLAIMEGTERVPNTFIEEIRSAVAADPQENP